MKKLKIVVLFSVVLTLILSMILFVGCNDKPDIEPDNNTDNVKPITDDDYTLTLTGLQNSDGNH